MNTHIFSFLENKVPQKKKKKKLKEPHLMKGRCDLNNYPYFQFSNKVPQKKKKKKIEGASLDKRPMWFE